MFEFLTLKNLPEMQLSVLRPSSRTRPAIRLVKDGAVKAVVKDFSPLGAFFRNTAGRFLVWRETLIYRRLQGIEGTPELFRVIDGLALVIGEIPGRSLENLEREVTLTESFFDELELLVEKVHDRGIAHCDLKKAANTLLGENARPYIIDWGAAILKREFRWYPLNLVFQRFLIDDSLAIIKLKVRHIPEKVSREEIERCNRRSRAERLVRRIRDILRQLLQRVV
jgi:tRNA A-37 threonylcarbamoyl transferase component Bud32